MHRRGVEVSLLLMVLTYMLKILNMSTEHAILVLIYSSPNYNRLSKVLMIGYME
jgi:hypothetical protein